MIFDITQQFFQTVQSFKNDDCDSKQSTIDLQESFSRKYRGSKFSLDQQQSIQLSIESQLYHRYSNDIFQSISKILNIMKESKETIFQTLLTVIRHLLISKDLNSIYKLGLHYELNQIVNKGYHRNQTQKQHMKSLVICLFQFFKTASSQFKQFIEFNEIKKQKILNTIAMQSKRERKPYALARKISSIDEQLQKESAMIYMEKVSQQKQIQETRKTLENISQTLNQMSNKVLEQELLTSSFMEIGETGLFHLNKGNENLVQANSLSKESGKYWTYYFLLLAVSLLVFDFIKS